MSRNIVTQIDDLRYKLISRLTTHRPTAIFAAIILVGLLLFMYNFIFDSSQSSRTKFLSHVVSMLGINETLYFTRFLNSGISLEGIKDCNLNKQADCFTVNKSLVVTFWRDSSREKWLAKNILKVFPDENFVRIVMVHDSSNWSSFPDKEMFIWIHVNAQRRFWYVKRFLTPPVLRAYKYLWILDDDVELLFSPLHYECVATKLNVSLSSPGRLEGIASHQITRVNNDFVEKIGRWTDFVEIGPILVSSTSAWECIWHFMSPFTGLAWGLDLIWCRLLAHNCKSNSTMHQACAILDIFHVNHLANYIASTEEGNKERPIYDQYYEKFHTQVVNIGPLANDRTLYSSCAKN